VEKLSQARENVAAAMLARSGNDGWVSALSGGGILALAAGYDSEHGVGQRSL
jgi:hypothetical protein